MDGERIIPEDAYQSPRWVKPAILAGVLTLVTTYCVVRMIALIKSMAGRAAKPEPKSHLEPVRLSNGKCLDCDEVVSDANLLAHVLLFHLNAKPMFWPDGTPIENNDHDI